MIRILTIIGARPQIIKAAAVSRAVAESFNGVIEEKILHTGQHYDDSMSSVFFRELGIPSPHFNLGVGSASPGVQTARMIEGIEKVLMQEHFDGVILYGDTNSTLAGAVAASKLQVPVFHIEAGLRSYNMAMPEEVNRIVCDNLSSILFAPTENAVRNLEKEGFFSKADTDVHFQNGKGRVVCNSGDVMYDNSLYFSKLALERSDILSQLELTDDQFVLATVHRDFNTDNPKRLISIFEALVHIAEEKDVKIVIPLHPRTRKKLAEVIDSNDTGGKDGLSGKLRGGNVKIIEPVTFFDMIALENNAAIVITDSGGVQKEAFFYEKPCVILRPETEWSEIVENGAAVLADADFDGILAAYESLSGKNVSFPQVFGDGNASVKILEKIVNYFK